MMISRPMDEVPYNYPTKVEYVFLTLREHERDQRDPPSNISQSRPLRKTESFGSSELYTEQKKPMVNMTSSHRTQMLSLS